MESGSALLLNSPHQSLFITAGQWVYAEDPEVSGQHRHGRREAPAPIRASEEIKSSLHKQAFLPLSIGVDKNLIYLHSGTQ